MILRPQGLTLSGDYVLPANRGVRGDVCGWSSSSASRHVRWLQSVSHDELDGHGYAITLTVRDLPADAETWHAMRRAFFKRLERLGMFRWHWVVEWQPRYDCEGVSHPVPHLHMAGYWSEPLNLVRQARIKWHWNRVCDRFGVYASVRRQWVKRIAGPTGWAAYCAKHSGRSAAHYQRGGMPDGWETSGRLWGHSRFGWPRWQLRYELELRDMWKLRRLLKSWRKADACKPVRHTTRCATRSSCRCEQLRRRRIVRARKLYQGDGREMWGTTEWVGPHTYVRMLETLSSGRLGPVDRLIDQLRASLPRPPLIS